MKVKSWLTLIQRRCFFKLVEVSDHMEGVFNLLVYSSSVLCMFFLLFFFSFLGREGIIVHERRFGKEPSFFLLFLATAVYCLLF